jgi:hypothetical protein
MTTDRTTKALLAVIAVALSVIAAKDLGRVATAAAGYGEGQKVIVTNYQTKRNGFGELLFVHCTNCK